MPIFMIEDTTIRPLESQKQAIKRFPKPSNVRQVCAFRDEDAVFNFGQEQEKAFETLKLALITDPVLKLFKIGAPTEDGIGAVLLQKNEEDENRR